MTAGIASTTGLAGTRLAGTRLAGAAGALALSLAILPLSSQRALADGPFDVPASPYEFGGTFSFTLENDIFADSDQDYTNGVRLSYISQKDDLQLVGRWARDELTPLIGEADWYMIYALGQNMFTPSDIEDPNPPDNERPYAGFLYGSVGVVADTGSKLHTFALDLGVVGPASLAEPTQKLVHEIGNFAKPVGWDQQLENEPAFRLIYEHKQRALVDIAAPLPFFQLQADVLPHATFALGTVDTSAALGLTVRLGEELADDYGPPRVRPAVGGPGLFSDGGDMVSWYVFAGVEGRAVGRNLFLEGNTFDQRDGVTVHHFVADAQLGAALRIGSVELAYTHVLRTEEYAAQDGPAEFGSINIRTNF